MLLPARSAWNPTSTSTSAHSPHSPLDESPNPRQHRAVPSPTVSESCSTAFVPTLRTSWPATETS
jgi:hypothetical protein